MAPYAELQTRLAKGWNTWNVANVLSHVRLPDGIAINLGFKQYKHNAQLHDALIARPEQREERVFPGLRSYDGSYTELTVHWKELEVLVQSATVGGDLLLLATPKSTHRRAPLAFFKGSVLWNRHGTVSREGNTITFRTPQEMCQVYPTTRPVEDPYIFAQGPYLAMPLDGPVGVSTGKPRHLEEITELLASKRAEEEERIRRFPEKHGIPEDRAEALGMADLYEAIQTSLAWDSVYDPSKNRVITPVSRVFSMGLGGYVLFCWDNYFAAYLFSLDNKNLAYANAIEITRERTAAGFVPNFAQADGMGSGDRSEPPVGAIMVRELYRRFHEQWLLEEVFDGLLEWNRWWHACRENQGLLAWGSTPYEPIADMHWETHGVNDSAGASLESGLDNSPMYEGMPFDKERHVMLLADVGLNSLYIADCRALAEIADVLGQFEAAKELRDRAEAYTRALATLWDDTTGLFLNRRMDTGEFSARIAPTHFYPLLARAATPKQAERMIREHFFNPAEFWGEHVLPSIARNDPAYPDQDYWRGRIWGPMNFLVYLGLRQYDLPDARAALVDKSAALLLRGWRAGRYVCENYSAETGLGGEENAFSDRFYHWGGLLGLIAMIEEGVLSPPERPLH